MEWKIGNIKIDNQVVLAPMAGISNPAFMKIVEEMGVGYAVTELISAEAIVRNNKKTFDMLNGIETLKIPVGVQVFGSNPKVMAKAAKIITESYSNLFIDINMGCPVPKVALRSEAGSALLKNPDKVYQIVSEVVKSVSTPVTVKIRSGWDRNAINAVEVAKVCEEAGASAICVHPRTRSDGYSGKADWNVIKDVKMNVSIPVIGNGDIKGYEDAKRMLDETGCDAVMIGRGVLGNPWLIKEVVLGLEGKRVDTITSRDKILMCKKHFNYLLNTKSEKLALLEIRSHAVWYLKGIPNSNHMKTAVFNAKNKEELQELLDNYLQEL